MVDRIRDVEQAVEVCIPLLAGPLGLCRFLARDDAPNEGDFILRQMTRAGFCDRFPRLAVLFRRDGIGNGRRRESMPIDMGNVFDSKVVDQVFHHHGAAGWKWCSFPVSSMTVTGSTCRRRMARSASPLRCKCRHTSPLFDSRLIDLECRQDTAHGTAPPYFFVGASPFNARK
jgi:hypothetical protein